MKNYSSRISDIDIPHLSTATMEYMQGHKDAISEAEDIASEADREIKKLTDKLDHTFFVLDQIRNDLPRSRDWLDPAIEREMDSLLTDYLEHKNDPS